MNPLQEARAKASGAWRSARDGTVRTTRWATGGLASAPRRAASKLRRGAPSDSGPGLWARSGGRLVAAIRARPGAAAAWGGGVAIAAIWIGWTVYVWIENGAAAGIGVLISWPAVFAALAIIFSPFVGAGLLVHRHRAADGPAVAGGNGSHDDQPGEADEPG